MIEVADSITVNPGGAVTPPERLPDSAVRIRDVVRGADIGKADYSRASPELCAKSRIERSRRQSLDSEQRCSCSTPAQ